MKLRHALREVNVRGWVGVLTFIVVSVMPIQAAHAYVGPGAGFAVISSFLIFFVAFALVGRRVKILRRPASISQD